MRTVLRNEWRTIKGKYPAITRTIRFRDALGPSLDKLPGMQADVYKPIFAARKKVPTFVAAIRKCVDTIDQYEKAVKAIKDPDIAKDQQAMLSDIKKFKSAVNDFYVNAKNLENVLVTYTTLK